MKDKKSFYDRQKEMRYISRLDNKHQHGWRVRMGQKAEVSVGKFFSDFKYKDEKQSLKAAQRFRNRIAATLFNNRALRVMRRYHHGLPVPFVPGNVRYRCYKTHRTYNGKKLGPYFCEYYVAYWYPTPGDEKSKSFSVKKHGREEAERLAFKYFRGQIKHVKAEK